MWVFGIFFSILAEVCTQTGENASQQMFLNPLRLHGRRNLQHNRNIFLSQQGNIFGLDLFFKNGKKIKNRIQKKVENRLFS